MRVVYRAEDEPAATREDYWRHVIGDTVVPMDVRFTADLDGRDTVVAGELGALRVAELISGPGEVSRTRTHIRRSDPDLLQVFVHGRGYVAGEQAGHHTRLRPGDVGLVDAARPFRCVHSASHVVSLTFPRTLLPVPGDWLARLAGTRILGDRGPAALLSPLIRELPRQLHDVNGNESSRIGTAVVDLLAATVAAQFGRTAHLSPHTRQGALVHSIRGFIDKRLADPDLSPVTIAAAHHISVRYLHKLFAGEDTTVTELIRTRRLEKCRRDLLDPALRSLPVSAIAARHGLLNAAHFSRAFRGAYGVAPSECREIANS